MARRRFYTSPDKFNFQTQTVTLTSDEARHLRDVLRLRVGDECFVFDGVGNEFRCKVELVARDQTDLSIQDKVSAASPESSLLITLAVALLKGEKFDLVVQKATELGVVKIIPVTTRYADIQLRDQRDATKRVGRWQRIALEAAKQSGRAVVPKIVEPQDIRDLMKNQDESLRIMFSEKSGKHLNEISSRQPAPDSVVVLVGPEGGWSDDELALAHESDWQIVTLSGRVLRAETAAIVATTLVQHKLGDLR